MYLVSSLSMVSIQVNKYIHTQPNDTTGILIKFHHFPLLTFKQIRTLYQLVGTQHTHLGK